MKNTIQKSINVISGLITKIIKIEKGVDQNSLLSEQYQQIKQRLDILSSLLNQQVEQQEKQQDFSKLIGWRITNIDKNLIQNDFDMPGMLDYVIGEYIFAQNLDTQTIYSYGCKSKTYWFQPGGQIYEEQADVPFSGNYHILYLDYEDGYWAITIQGLMQQTIYSKMFLFNKDITYKDIDLRTLGLPVTFQPIFSQGNNNYGSKLEFVNTNQNFADYTGIYQLQNNQLQGYDRVWIKNNTDTIGIVYFSEYNEWVIATRNGINDQWLPFDGLGNGENPWDNPTETKYITVIE